MIIRTVDADTIVITLPSVTADDARLEIWVHDPKANIKMLRFGNDEIGCEIDNKGVRIEKIK